jgi:hypothetical protein
VEILNYLKKSLGIIIKRLEETGILTVQPNLDVALSTRASESTLSGIKSQTDKLSFDASNRLAIQNPPNMDVALSTRASETTLSGIKSQTDKLTFDASNYLQVNVKSTVNPSNLDVALSTRASEATLSAIKNALASVGTDKIRASIVDSLPAGTNKIGSVDVASLPNPSNLDVALSTRASESTLSSFVGTPDSSPPSKGVVLLGYDGTYVRRVKTTSDGKLLAVLG